MLKVGTVVIAQNLVRATQYNGMDGVITHTLATRTCRNLRTSKRQVHTGYVVRWANGDERHVAPHNIRPKRPPSGEQLILDMIDRLSKEPATI